MSAGRGRSTGSTRVWRNRLGRRLPLAAKLYLISTVLAAIALVGVSTAIVQPELTQEIIITAVVLGLISLLLEFIDFPLLISGDTSFSTVAYMAMVVMLPFPLP